MINVFPKSWVNMSSFTEKQRGKWKRKETGREDKKKKSLEGGTQALKCVVALGQACF
jgi:hypothetical protein